MPLRHHFKCIWLIHNQFNALRKCFWDGCLVSALDNLGTLKWTRAACWCSVTDMIRLRQHLHLSMTAVFFFRAWSEVSCWLFHCYLLKRHAQMHYGTGLVYQSKHSSSHWLENGSLRRFLQADMTDFTEVINAFLLSGCSLFCAEKLSRLLIPVNCKVWSGALFFFGHVAMPHMLLYMLSWIAVLWNYNGNIYSAIAHYSSNVYLNYNKEICGQWH